MVERTRFVLGDLLDAADLELELVVGGRAARARSVVGAQSSEIDHPTRCDNLDVVRAARALRLHPNSVRYRLARAEELLGAPLRMPMTIAALEMAMTLNEQDRSGTGDRRSAT
jgi:hypothetical protein